MGHLQTLNRTLLAPKPIFLKIAPDLNNHQLDDIIQVVMETKIQGIIATNTTISRENLQTADNYIAKIGTGGLSGKPLCNRSTEIIRYIAQKSKHAFTIIGVGGIGVAVFNNYRSGRREKQMTEVTRTAAVDERFMELYDASRETTFQENMAEVLYQYEWIDYDNFLEKYGPKTNVTSWAKIQSLAQYFEGIGVMLQSNSVEIDQVYRLLSTKIIRCWEKLQSVILEQRQRELDPRIYSSFES